MDKLLQLLQESSGKLSHSKLWVHIAGIIASGVFVYEAVHGRMSEWLFLAYVGTFIAHRSMSKKMEKKDE